MISLPPPPLSLSITPIQTMSVQKKKCTNLSRDRTPVLIPLGSRSHIFDWEGWKKNSNPPKKERKDPPHRKTWQQVDEESIKAKKTEHWPERWAQGPSWCPADRDVTLSRWQEHSNRRKEKEKTLLLKDIQLSKSNWQDKEHSKKWTEDDEIKHERRRTSLARTCLQTERTCPQTDQLIFCSSQKDEQPIVVGKLVFLTTRRARDRQCQSAKGNASGTRNRHDYLYTQSTDRGPVQFNASVDLGELDLQLSLASSQSLSLSPCLPLSVSLFVYLSLSLSLTHLVPILCVSPSGTSVHLHGSAVTMFSAASFLMPDTTQTLASKSKEKRNGVL